MRSICWLFVLTSVFAGCKSKKEQQKNYPIIDERGDTPLPVASLDAESPSPFPQDVFVKPCGSSKLTRENLKVAVSQTSFVGSDPVFERKAHGETVLVENVFSADKGVLKSAGLRATDVGVGGKQVGRLSIGDFSSVGEAVRAARSQIESLSFKVETKETAEPKLRLCSDNLIGDTYDATDLEVRQHAAIASAAFIGNAFRSTVTKLTEPRYSSLLGGAKEPSAASMTALAEIFVDYDFSAPAPGGGRARFIRRYVFSENMHFLLTRRFQREGNNAKLWADRAFLITPHSETYRKLKGDFGSYWNIPVLVYHEFGHLLFAESVYRPVDYGEETPGQMSLLDYASYIPQLLFGLEKEKVYVELRQAQDGFGLVDPVPNEVRGSGVNLPERKTAPGKGALVGSESFFPGTSDSLTRDQRNELVRRVQWSMRGVEEGIADIFGAALAGSYSGFKAACFGPDRDPRAGSFGLGRTSSPKPKRIPVGLDLYDATYSNLSWSIQNSGGDARAILADNSDCNGNPRTLESPYILASVLTHWLEESVKDSTGKSFVELPASARHNFVFDAVTALKSAWREWMLMMRQGHLEGRFTDFDEKKSAADLMVLASRVSLMPTVTALIESLFSKTNPESWVMRHSELLTNQNVEACKKAVEHGLIPHEACR